MGWTLMPERPVSVSPEAVLLGHIQSVPDTGEVLKHYSLIEWLNDWKVLFNTSRTVLWFPQCIMQISLNKRLKWAFRIQKTHYVLDISKTPSQTNDNNSISASGQVSKPLLAPLKRGSVCTQSDVTADIAGALVSKQTSKAPLLWP